MYPRCCLCSDALDLPVPRVALLDEGPRRATLHANRAAAYLERYKEVTAAASKDANSSTQALTGSGSNSINDSSSSSSVRWLETGGMLDGLQLDGSSPETWAQLLQATVLDCKSALDLVPTHTKAHFRCALPCRRLDNHAVSTSIVELGWVGGCHCTALLLEVDVD